MGEKVKKTEWQSIHWDYQQFAIQACYDCHHKGSTPETQHDLNKAALEAVRYSYDCLEATIEFIFHIGSIDTDLFLIHVRSFKKNIRQQAFHNRMKSSGADIFC